MDQFESIVATLLEANGYWVRRSFKVNVTKDEKRQIGKPSIPRPEIDLLALRFDKNELLALEVKSYFDSNGVKLSALQKQHDEPQGPYKLFTSDRYRSIVLARLKQDLIASGMTCSETTIHLGLAAGKVYQGKSEQIRSYMESRNWLFWSPEDVKQQVERLAECGYANDIATLTAKILLRGQ